MEDAVKARQDLAKRAAGQQAAEWIMDGMVVGLGSGSTAKYFIDALIQRVATGLKITAVATSKTSAQHAHKGGIEILDLNSVEHIDIDIDGADEIDAQKRMIKGGGGALLREKIVATASQELVIIIDASKKVEQLGGFPLPVEVVPFGWALANRALAKRGLHGCLRQVAPGTPYMTDGGNYILDIPLDTPVNPKLLHRSIKEIPGVVETGFFLEMAGRIIVGHSDGTTDIIS